MTGCRTPLVGRGVAVAPRPGLGSLRQGHWPPSSLQARGPGPWGPLTPRFSVFPGKRQRVRGRPDPPEGPLFCQPLHQRPHVLQLVEAAAERDLTGPGVQLHGERLGRAGPRPRGQQRQRPAGQPLPAQGQSDPNAPERPKPPESAEHPLPPPQQPHPRLPGSYSRIFFVRLTSEGGKEREKTGTKLPVRPSPHCLPENKNTKKPSQLFTS